jgi:hypothetical protein
MRYSRPVADPAARPEVALREERGELSRYAADYLAARAPLGPSLLAGAIAALGVYLVPLAVVAASFVLPRLVYAVVFPVSWLAVHLMRPGAGGQAPGAPATPPPAPPTSVPFAVPTPGIESVADAGAPGGAGWAAALVAFWPVAMVVIGLVAAAVYRARRTRRLDDLAHHPVDVSILPEVVLFYVLTAGAALLVRLDSFVALGANAVFAWAGYVIWRWLYDRLLPRLVPAGLRAAAVERAGAEAALRRRQRETG